jgi:thioredoxin reductase (NADPH)
LPRFEGTGVYYGASYIEGQLCRGEEVILVGGRNSAGQAAVFLAGSEIGCKVHLLVRGGGLVESMSRYLIQRIENTPEITLHTRTEVTALEGGDHLEHVQ